MESLFSVSDYIMEANGDVGSWLGDDMPLAIATILLAALVVAVGFVAFKLIKRALNKA